MPEVGFDKEVGTPGSDPAEWLGEVQSTWLSYEHNPFTRLPFFNEAYLFPLTASCLVELYSVASCENFSRAFPCSCIQHLHYKLCEHCLNQGGLILTP